MRPELWEKVQAITAEVLELAGAGREDYLRDRCGDDVETLAAVRMLLDASEEMSEGFLEAPALDPLAESFGHYRARSEIGRGGMSVVYLGERVSGEFHREVAIKVAFGPGAMAHEETRILASLEHPNIARLFDAGTTASGFRYLVMEYVSGTRIDHYSRGLDSARVLRLLLQVCAGVHYANRSFIVHRDLKPGNIFVTTDGVVKLLDFGIAKILPPEPEADFTTGMRAWTPDYASPEQILGQPVTASTDVYSLGVLLCELLGGERPRRFAGLPLGEVVERAAREEITEVPLTGELAWIARKALRRDPAERYESAAAMARDIEHHLEGRPILARPPSWIYSARKFVSRNRWRVAAVALAASALIATTAVAVTQARRASQRFDQVRGLANSVLFEIYPEVARLEKSLPARQLLAQRSVEYLDGLSRDPDAGAGLELEMARGYLRLADIFGTSAMASLGDSNAALVRTGQAVALARRALAREPGSAHARRVLFDGLTRIATTQILRGDAGKGIAAAREAVALTGQDLAADPNDRARADAAAEALHTLASASFRVDTHVEDWVELWEKAIAIRRRLMTTYPRDDDAKRSLSRTLSFFAEALVAKQRSEIAEPLIREAYGINKERWEAGAPGAGAHLASSLGYLGVLAWKRDANEEAAGFFEEQLRLREQIARREPADAHMARGVASAMSRLAHSYARLGRFRQAIALGERALAHQRKAHAADPKNVVSAREFFYAAMDLADACARSGRMSRACRLTEEAGGTLKKMTAQQRAQVASGPAERHAELERACR